MQQSFTLPLPPSVNSLYRNVPGKGRVRTESYKIWQAAAGWDMNLARPKAMLGEVFIEIVAGRPDNRRRDCSNLIKATEDLLVKHGVIEDDSKVRKISVEWGAEPFCRVTVTGE